MLGKAELQWVALGYFWIVGLMGHVLCWAWGFCLELVF